MCLAGIGKSTLLNLIAGTLEPTKGHIARNPKVPHSRCCSPRHHCLAHEYRRCAHACCGALHLHLMLTHGTGIFQVVTHRKSVMADSAIS